MNSYMDNKTATSASDSFFFQLIPKHFKVDHGFAKTIKPNTSYRLCIFKGTLVWTQASRRPKKWQNPSRGS